MENVLVVCNFKAGRKTAIKYKKYVVKFLLKHAKSFKLIEISSLAELNVDMYDTLIAMGGDGTVNKLLPYLINSDKTLGIIPCGTANLLAAKLGISTNIKKALKIIQKSKTKKIDVFSVNNSPCVLRFGLGYDANIIGKTPQSLKNKFGYFAYFIAGILFALRLKKLKYHIFFDEKEMDTNASCIIIANAANMYQTLVSVGSECLLDDGLMDVFILKTQNPINFFIEFLNIIVKRRINSSRALYFKASSLKITNKWCLSHIDGEKKIFKEDLNFEIINKSVNVFSN